MAILDDAFRLLRAAVRHALYTTLLNALYRVRSKLCVSGCEECSSVLYC